ncbi:glycosyltransferase family 2 protein [Streptomyces lavendulocolor]|uniref:Glycosyltransferase family 2 protein n=1 Tax=Streptomyces lavendulocolor TaxID=67316 RepID=A0ABV2W961_9ACTN
MWAPAENTRATALTVILPHYDCAAYLGQAAGSVLGQDFRDLTLVVVDDCSPGDAWSAALRPFADDPRLVVLRTSRNVGHLRIKNAVLEHVRSPYVGFQDSDDISLPGRFRHQIALLERGRADLVGCGYECIDATGRVTGRRRMPRNGNLWMRLGRSTVALHPSTVVRGEVLRRLGGFDGTARLGADTDFHLRAARLYRLRNVGRVLYRYRVWPDSLTQAPETGFGSDARRAYTESLRRREEERRRAGSRAELLPLLIAPPNDVDFTLDPVDLA